MFWDDGTRESREKINNHQRDGSTVLFVVQPLIYGCIGCKYRPNQFVESLVLSFKSKYPESNFITRLDSLCAATSKLTPFREVKWSTNLWLEYERFRDAPFLIRNYPDIWKDGKCPTEGQFIKCSYQIDAHTDGVVYTSFVQFSANAHHRST